MQQKKKTFESIFIGEKNFVNLKNSQNYQTLLSSQQLRSTHNHYLRANFFIIHPFILDLHFILTVVEGWCGVAVNENLSDRLDENNFHHYEFHMCVFVCVCGAVILEYIIDTYIHYCDCYEDVFSCIFWAHLPSHTLIKNSTTTWHTYFTATDANLTCHTVTAVLHFLALVLIYEIMTLVVCVLLLFPISLSL